MIFLLKMRDHRFHSSAFLPSFGRFRNPTLTNRGKLQSQCLWRATIAVIGLDGPVCDVVLLFDELVPHNIFNNTGNASPNIKSRGHSMRFAFSLLNECQLHQPTLMVEVLTQKGIVLLLQFVHLIDLFLKI